MDRLDRCPAFDLDLETPEMKISASGLFLVWSIYLLIAAFDAPVTADDALDTPRPKFGFLKYALSQEASGF